jgi:hypothetical protein
MDFVWFLEQTAIIFLKSVNKLIFEMVKCCVFFAARTEFLYIIYMNLGFKALIVGRPAVEENGEHRVLMCPVCVILP